MDTVGQAARSGEKVVSAELFVGRAAEVGLLRDLLAGVKAGVGSAVLVAGEQGVGKSSLLRAGLGDAGSQGCRLLWDAADELGQRIPLWLMAGVLGTAEGVTAGDGLMGGDPVMAGIERLLAAVDQLCAQSPVVLVAEDLQWADEASLLMWHRLGRAVSQLPLLLVGSCRLGSGYDDLTRLRRAVSERNGLVLDLGPLSEGEVHQLVGALAGGRPGTRLAGVIERAGGNPLYTRELVDALVRQRRLLESRGFAELAGGSDIVVPASLVAAIDGRLGALPEDAAQVLRWAALLGHEFSVPDLEIVSGRSAGELMEVVHAATGAGVLAESGVRLGFRHGLIRQALYEGMPAGLRASLHLQAARMLASVDAPPERVAAQLLPAGLSPAPGQETYALDDMPAREWATGWLASAAPVLIYRAPQVAAELLLGVLNQIAGSDPRRPALEANLVEVLFRLERYHEAERAGTRLLGGETNPQRAAETSWLVAFAMMRTGRVAEALARVMQEMARSGQTGSQLARLHALQSMILSMIGDISQAEETALQALTGAEQEGDPLAAGYALHGLASVSFVRREQAAMLGYIDRGLSLTETVPQATDMRLLMLANKALLLADLDRQTEAIATARQTLALAERAGTPRIQLARATLGHLHFYTGEWDDALAELEPAATADGPAYERLMIYGPLALIAGHRGEVQAAAEHLRAVENVALDSGAARAVSTSVRLARSLAAEQEGRLDAAKAVLADCLDPSVAEGMPEVYQVLTDLARLALAGGDQATAASAARLAEAEAEREPVPFKTALADHCRGLVTGDPALLLAAADYFEDVSRPFYRAQALESAAVLDAQHGKQAAAQRYLGEAVGIYISLGAVWDVRRAAARLKRYGIKADRTAHRKRPATGWEALTPTELKIAYLVAEGRSNPDVAATLFLSRNTVQTHVSHILAKLGARSRAEIICEALHHPPGRATA
jgi:DNA-binding CsgD family transcriptional regulator